MFQHCKSNVLFVKFYLYESKLLTDSFSIKSSTYLAFPYAGNYDEGFGREQHKTKWTGKPNESAEHSDAPTPSEERNGNHEEPGEVVENGEIANQIVNGDAPEVTAEA